MSFLYVTEQGSHVKKKGAHIQVVKDGEVITDMLTGEIETLVLKLFNRKILDDDDFEKDKDTGQVYLKKESLKLFIRHYEEWANSKNRTMENDREMSWRNIFWKQGEKLRKCIENDTVYTPFSWKQAVQNIGPETQSLNHDNKTEMNSNKSILPEGTS